MYKVSNSTIRLSVRHLVEFVLKSGDIDNRRRPTRDAMQEGSRIHRMIQKRMGSAYQAEVPLKINASLAPYLQELRNDPGDFPYEISQEMTIALALEGRADGILTQEEGVTIDEIKGTYRRVDHIEAPEPVHVAQAVCYGYIYATQKQLEQVTIQVTYCNMESEEIRQFQTAYPYARLEEEFTGYLREYTKWAAFLICHRQVRNASLQQLTFPFPYRPGQKDLAVAVYRTIAREKTLFIQAPTGIGKTLSVIFPSVKAMGEGKAEKLFYLTAKTIARSVAEESMKILQKQGMKLTYMTITAKEKLCPLTEMDCNPQSCPMAAGYFDRSNEAVYDMICHEGSVERETILQYAKKHNVCPFEFSLDLSEWVDGIICDYNYVFDPNVHLQRYFSEGERGEYLFLVDEAHNLVDRARDMYSAALIKEDILEAKKWYQGYPHMVKKLNRCNRELLSLKRTCETYEVIEEGDLCGLVRVMEQIYGDLQEFPDLYPDAVLPKEAGEFFFTVRDFLQIYELADENYTFYMELLEDGRFMVRLFCVNPAVNLQSCMARGISTVFFSATLLPIQYYRRLLSGNQEDYCVYVPSPFPEENRLLCIGRDVTSKYTRRGPGEYRKIAEYIWQISQGKLGNYLVFFPSYQFLEKVKEAFVDYCTETLHGTCVEPERAGAKEEDLQEAAALLRNEKNMLDTALLWEEGLLSESDVETEADSMSGQELVSELVPVERTGLELMQQEENIVIVKDTDAEKNGTVRIAYPETCRIEAAGRQVLLYVQESSMSEAQRTAFLQQFAEGGDTGRIGFCVIGGSFSEGIDLQKDRLIGVIVVGTGLPQICTERELLKRHFDEAEGNGYAFAYLYPGMNKVLQAAGRLVRTPEDTGVIALLDERFLRREYMDLFPEEWSRYLPVSRGNVAGGVADFWKRL